jgi:hypothetical protein
MGTADRLGRAQRLPVRFAGSNPATCRHPVYAVTMADETPPTGWADRAGAVLLVLLAAGLLFIGADILTGGKLTGRGGCGCDDTGNGTDS